MLTKLTFRRVVSFWRDRLARAGLGAMPKVKRPQYLMSSMMAFRLAISTVSRTP